MPTTPPQRDRVIEDIGHDFVHHDGEARIARLKEHSKEFELTLFDHQMNLSRTRALPDYDANSDDPVVRAKALDKDRQIQNNLDAIEILKSAIATNKAAVAELS